tara:strand:+ start:374 stop:571 length:198 start_codon:yes stop_codon:yes gene_type:complete
MSDEGFRIITHEDIVFNASQFVEALHKSNVRLYEDVLDTIANYYERVGTWERDDDGNMVLTRDEQ